MPSKYRRVTIKKNYVKHFLYEFQPRKCTYFQPSAVPYECTRTHLFEASLMFLWEPERALLKKKWQREHICSEMHVSGFNYSSCSFTSFSNPQHLTYALLFVWNRPVLGPRHDNGAGIHWWTAGGISNIRSILDAGTCYPHGIHQRHVQSVHQTFRWRRRSTRKNSESASSKSSRSAIRVASAEDTGLLWWEKTNAFSE